jgi:hypothetical protein
MAKKKYRVGVVGGAGTWGRRYLGAFAEREDCEVILVDRAGDRARQFAEHFGIETVLDNLDDLLTDKVPDVVSTILPVSQTHGAVLACAEAGVKAISCEKPMAVELSHADEMVDLCGEKGAAFACGTAYWEVPQLIETAEWIAQGHIGTLQQAAIPGGLPKELSGAGCVQLTQMRLVTGMEVEWVEGWVLPPAGGWTLPEGAAEHEIDCPAYGRLGLSGGIVCEIPAPRAEADMSCRVWVEGEQGQAWMNAPMPTLIRGKGPESTPVYPDFFTGERLGPFKSIAAQLVQASETGGEVLCSGHDYRQALEIALALKLSARNGHKRVYLPLPDRSLQIYPHVYRLQGGDIAGWESIGYTGPPEVEGKPKR